MPWQLHVADVALELLPDGTLAYDRVVLTVPRQSGKTTLLLSVITHRSVAEFPGGRLDVGPQKQTVVYTAQTRNDARKKWIKEFTPLLERSPFRRQFEKRLTNGSEGFDWRNGSTFDLVATMEKSGHGDTLDLGLIDEAFAQVDDRLEQAMEPATITRTSSQLWIVSTAGDAPGKSPFLWGEVVAGRRIAAAGQDSRTAYFEWSCDPETDDLDDMDVVAARHPAVGFTITVDDLRGKHQKALEKRAAGEKDEDGKDPLAGFRRAYCNVWGTHDEVKDPKLPQSEWAASASLDEAPGKPVASAAFDVDEDGRSASIAIGMGSLANPYVELVTFDLQVGWLPDAITKLAKKWGVKVIGCKGSGPAGAQVGPVQLALRNAGLEIEVKQLTSTERHQACGGLYVDVNECRLERLAGQIELDEAGADAVGRSVGGDAWEWDRNQATVPISPLWAVTIARALLPIEEEGEPHIW